MLLSCVVCDDVIDVIMIVVVISSRGFLPLFLSDCGLEKALLILSLML